LLLRTSRENQWLFIKGNDEFDTPILGSITKEQFFKSITEVIRITQLPQSMIIG
jgi:hypothetical protein